MLTLKHKQSDTYIDVILDDLTCSPFSLKEADQKLKVFHNKFETEASEAPHFDAKIALAASEKHKKSFCLTIPE